MQTANPVAQQQMQIVCPPGAMAGAMIQVNVNGQMMTVQVTAPCARSSPLCVRVPLVGSRLGLFVSGGGGSARTPTESDGGGCGLIFLPPLQVPIGVGPGQSFGIAVQAPAVVAATAVPVGAPGSATPQAQVSLSRARTRPSSYAAE